MVGAERTPPPRLGTDSFSVVLVLGVAQGAEDDALLGGHDPTNLA